MAHQYPPTPLYGQYPAAPYYPPQAFNPQQQAMRPPPGGYQPNIPNSSAPLQYFNPPRFDGHTQIPSHSAFAPFPPPVPLTPEMFRHFGASNAQPPPPPSFSNLGFPSFAQQPSLSDPFSRPQNITPYDGAQASTMWNTPTEQADHSRPPVNQENTEYRKPVEPLDNASEDGEVSDGEIDGSAGAFANQSSRTISQDDATIPLEPDHWPTGSSLPGIGEHSQPSSNTAAFAAHSRTAPTNLGPQQQLTHNVSRNDQPDLDVVLSDSGESASSYNPPSASTPGSTQDVPNSAPTPIEKTQDLARDISTRQHAHKSAAQMRELAKGALLSLAPHNIRFSDLLHEGIDSRILQELYAELGFQDLPSNLSSMLPSTSQLQVPASKPSSTDRALNTNILQQTPLSRFGSGSLNGKHVEAPTPERIQSISPAVIAAIDPKIAAQFIASSKNVPQSQLGLSPHLERKDRIAQLLAAKTGKLPSNRNTPETPSPVLATKPVPPSLVGPPPGVVQGPIANIPVQVSSTTESFLNSFLTQNVTKSTAQTEVVRQKTESLKREALVKGPNMTEGQASTTIVPGLGNWAEAIDGSPQTNDDNEPLPNETLELGIGSPRLLDSNELLNKAPEPSRPQMAQRTPSVIPGLFMTSEDYQRSEPTSTVAIEAELNRSRDGALSECTHPSKPFTSPLRIEQSQVGTIETQYGMATVSQTTEEIGRLQKRPLAADSFVDVPPPPAKRPFARQGSSDVHTAIINGNLSDAVSEGEIMEIDDESPAGTAPIPNASFSQHADPLEASNLTSTSDLLRETFDTTAKTIPSRATSVTPNVLKEKITGNLQYLAKSQEIEAMRRKIAEAEERQKLKRSQSQRGSSRSSGQTTPVATRTMPTTSVLSSPTTAEHVLGQGPLAVRAAALKAEVLRQRALRRKTLQEGLPDLDDEVQKTRSRLAEAQAKLAQLRAEAERREAETRAALQREQDIIAEALRLEEQLQQGLTGRKQYSDELQNLDDDAPNGLPAGTSASDDPEQLHQTGFNSPSSGTSQHQNVESSRMEPPAPDRQSEEHVEATKTPATYAKGAQTVGEDAGRAGSVPPSTTSFAQRHSDNAENVLLHQQEVGSKSALTDREYSSKPSRLLGTFVDQEIVETASSSANGDREPVARHLQDPSVDRSDSSMDLDDESDGSASMSDSASDDYEPEEPQDHQIYPVEDESDEYDPEEAPVPVVAPGHRNEDDLEEYEPAEIIDLSAPTVTPEDGPPENEEHINSVSGTSTQVNVGEDALQLTEAATLTKPQETPKLVDAAVTSEVFIARSEPITRFIPYQSPLASLKSFRFNPSYNERVKEGYRSLTYSYNIDPKMPLCPTELSGEICMDPKCGEQHFRQMTLADAKILEQLASAHDITDKAQRDRFLVGVKKVIADLRIRKVKEFGEVAAELAAYRRRFREEQIPALLAPSP